MELDEIKRVRLEKLNNLRAEGLDPYAGGFLPSHTVAQALGAFSEGQEVALAGRLIANRSHGKVVFADIQDQTGKIQLFIKADALGIIKDLDIGDIIGVKGALFKTKTGQESVRVAEIQVLCKSLMSLPEKWHGLKDVETRYRQRYVDLIVNKEVRDLFIKRSQIIRYIRSFLDTRGFLEVETPMLQQMAGGARGRPFKSMHNAYDMEVFLRIAPELYLKRLLVGGLERVYEMNRNFRNEGISTRHNPEFTMLEVYQAYGNYEDMMKLTEDLISDLARDITGSYKITYQGKTIDFTPPWERRSFARIVDEKFGIKSEDDARTMLAKLGEHKAHSIKKGDRLTRSGVMKIVEEMLEEEEIVNPVFFTEYFTFLCPLAKTMPRDPGISQRFEVFIGGLEVGNAYSELNDPVEQRKRLTEDLEDDVETGNRNVDEDFLHALEYGMPPAGGLGIGVDRLVMLLTDAASIRDVILFPLLKPEGH
ncbi:MAG TPA: lysine--tRNA ligase [Candidatus Omnitrophica bacterium]|nr:MAG: lysine--tRNA ligase [Omnitrophica WOR_2 bacterium GWA2_53_43]HBO98005.1 lysine--tRNA ligase [Candidatus Omnitrophota bacterium]HCI44911.1 lysine--tRNA ligase [Candidatus Omnitrophota bacterium]